MTKKLVKKKYKKHLLSSLQKTKSTQTNQSVSADRIEEVKKSNFELKLLEIVDWFLDGHGKYTSNFVCFQLKSLLTNHPLNSSKICIKQLVVQTI